MSAYQGASLKTLDTHPIISCLHLQKIRKKEKFAALENKTARISIVHQCIQYDTAKQVCGWKLRTCVKVCSTSIIGKGKIDMTS